MTEVETIKVRTSSRAKAKAKNKGKKSKSKAKAKASASASVIVKLGKGGKDGRKEKPERQQPIIIQNTYAPPPISLSDTILSRQNLPMNMGDNTPYVPSTVSIPSNIPSAVPVGQAVMTHRQNAINNNLTEVENDLREYQDTVMSEGVRQMFDEYRNAIPNMPPNQTANNLFGNSIGDDMIERMSRLSTQTTPTATMGGDGSSSSSDAQPPPPPPLQLPAPNPANAPIVEEPMTSVQGSNSVDMTDAQQDTQTQTQAPQQQAPQQQAPQQQLRLTYPGRFLLPNVPNTPQTSVGSFNPDDMDTPSAGSYNPLFDDFEMSVNGRTVGTTQDLNPPQSVDTTVAVQPASVGATQAVQPEESAESEEDRITHGDTALVKGKGKQNVAENLQEGEYTSSSDTPDILQMLDEMQAITRKRKTTKNNNLQQQAFNTMSRKALKFYKKNIDPNFTGSYSKTVRDKIREFVDQ
jgi:hypothetical protein